MKHEAVLSLRAVTKRYGSSRGIIDVSLDVWAGEVFGFLGPNGAGKTTTIRLLLDIIRPSSGDMRLFGRDSRRDAVALHKRIGYLSGDMEIDRNLTGRQYLEYVTHLRGGIGQANIHPLAERLQCELHPRIKHLSRGNKQKIGLIAALMHDPDLLILDEPTSGLDPLIQAEFNNIVREHTQKGKTAFISSHILSEVQSICHRVGFIREGQLVDVQPLEELMEKAYKTLRIVFSQKSDHEKLSSIPGIEDIHTDGVTLHCRLSGDINRVIRALAKFEVRDITIQEADLEELFMHYYTDKGNTDA